MEIDMDDKYQNNQPSAAVREGYHNGPAPSPEARSAVERKLRLRFAPKKEAGE
jgi:hypothetical protein